MDLRLFGVPGLPMVEPGDDLVDLMLTAIVASGETLQQDDVLVIAQKIISKAEDRYLDFRDVVPSPEAEQIALEVDKDPRKVQAILNESNEVVRKRPGVLIVEQKLGFVQANAGIDQSNIDADGDNRCLLLPVDPDSSAALIRQQIKDRLGIEVAVIINDSIGRAWRMGSMGLAIGVAGFTALEDYVGQTDMCGNELRVTLVMGQTTEKAPVVLVRGYRPRDPEDAGQRGVKPLIRPREMDMFR
jgi:coenzyme F420-0:L-glutamate ligase/coenzyme F420-1:gamma-L-glutamate ligase